jgi:hypothetical protein
LRSDRFESEMLGVRLENGLLGAGDLGLFSGPNR